MNYLTAIDLSEQIIKKLLKRLINNNLLYILQVD